MDDALQRALVRSILERATSYPWRIQNIGALGLWLDANRRYRLHVWDEACAIGDAPIHDHPFGFTSTVVVGEITNTRYVEDPHGEEFVRERYVPGHEGERRADTIRLVGVSETLRADARYRQDAEELHESDQVPGTVTVLRFDEMPDDLPEVTSCRRRGTPWVSGQARAATEDEIMRLATRALDRFEPATGG